MSFERFIINLDHAHKNFKRLVRLFIQQEIETLDVIGIQPTGWRRNITSFTPSDLAAAFCSFSLILASSSGFILASLVPLSPLVHTT